VRSVSFFAAATWSILALFGLDLMVSLLAVSQAGQVDLVSRVLCQAVAFLGTLIFLTLIHEKDRPLAEVLGLRKTSALLCVVATALGLALHGPLTLIADAIYRRYPLPDPEMGELIELFRVPLLYQKVAIVLSAGMLGPAVEEMFFRGALFRGLRRQHPPGLTLIGVSLLFAAAHRDFRNFLPDLLGGLAMGYVRMLAGSLWPAVLLHAAFNSVSIAFALRQGPEADMLSRPQSLAAVLASLVLLALYRAMALRSETCAQARAEDAV
jgi:membrane protease YdiL (CAAX protease family)